LNSVLSPEVIPPTLSWIDPVLCCLVFVFFFAFFVFLFFQESEDRHAPLLLFLKQVPSNISLYAI